MAQRNEKRARLTDIDILICTEEFNKLANDKKGAIYHEALQLCDDLNLGGAWRRYKAFIERLHGRALNELTQGIDKAELEKIKLGLLAIAAETEE